MKVQSIVLVIIILLLLYIVIRYVFADVNTMSGLMSGTTAQIISPSSLANPSGLYSSNFAYNIWFYIDNYNYKSGDEKILLVRTDAAADMSGNITSITRLNPCPAITFAAGTNNMSVYVSNSGTAAARDAKCSGPVGAAGTGVANGQSAECCQKAYNPANSTVANHHANYAGYIFDPNGPGNTNMSNASSSAVISAVDGAQLIAANLVTAAGWYKAGLQGPVPAIDIAANPDNFGNGCDKLGHYKRYPDMATPLAGDTDYPYTYTYGADVYGYPLNKYGLPITSTDPTGRFSQSDLNASLANEKISVTNIPVQAWTMVTVNINQLNVEVYINGKLQTTGKLDSIATPSATAPVYITPNGGFAGWTSKFGYYPNSLNPQDIWNLYQNGYGGNWLSNLFGSYNVKISLIENGKPSSSVTI